MIREQKSPGAARKFRSYNLMKVRGVDHPATLQMSCIGTPAKKALEAATHLVQ